MTRNISLDILKGMAIYAVVIGHCDIFLNLPSISVDKYGSLYDFIYSFHMPLFMLISGYLSMSIERKTVVEVICSKFKRLIIPSIIWSLLSCLILSMSIMGVINEHWYLKCLFICSIGYSISYRLTHNFYLLHIIFLLLLLIVPGGSLWNCVYMYPFFMIGMVIHKYNWIEKFGNQSRKNKMSFTFIFITIYTILFLGWDGSMSHDHSRFKLLSIYCDDYLYDIYCFVYRIVIGVSATCTLYGLVEPICRGRVAKFFQCLGQYSIGIYLTHSYLIILVSYFIIEVSAPRFVIVLFVATFIVIIAAIVTHFLSKKKILSKYLLGQ